MALGANVTVRTSDAKQAVAKRLADVSEFQHGPMAVPDLAPNIQAVVVDLGTVCCVRPPRHILQGCTPLVLTPRCCCRAGSRPCFHLAR